MLVAVDEVLALTKRAMSTQPHSRSTVYKCLARLAAYPLLRNAVLSLLSGRLSTYVCADDEADSPLALDLCIQRGECHEPLHVLIDCLARAYSAAQVDSAAVSDSDVIVLSSASSSSSQVLCAQNMRRLLTRIIACELEAWEVDKSTSFDTVFCRLYTDTEITPSRDV